MSLEQDVSEAVLATSAQNLSVSSTQVDENHDLRDSGISMTENTNLNNFNHSNYEDFELRVHQQDMNINASPQEGSEQPENPPPIPPKSSLGFASCLQTSFEFRSSDVKEGGDSSENYSVPKLHAANGMHDNDETPC